MKIKLATISLLALVLANSAFAKEVTVPFIHLAVPAEGLLIKYSMDGQYPQKVSCIYENFYKGYLKYTENNMEHDAGVAFGSGDSGDQFYFTSKGQRWEKTQAIDSLDQYHVDARGYIIVKNTRYNSATAYASCFYMSEDSK